MICCRGQRWQLLILRSARFLPRFIALAPPLQPYHRQNFNTILARERRGPTVRHFLRDNINKNNSKIITTERIKRDMMIVFEGLIETRTARHRFRDDRSVLELGKITPFKYRIRSIFKKKKNHDHTARFKNW